MNFDPKFRINIDVDKPNFSSINRNFVPPSDAIELNRNELQRTKQARNRPPYTKRFICDDCKLTTIKNAPSSVIIKNYLA